MIIGIRANDYNATYEETAFEIIPRGGVYEIRDIESGIAFFIEKGEFDDQKRSKTRVVTYQGDGERHTGSRAGDRTADDGGNKDDNKLYPGKHLWITKQQSRGCSDKGRGIQSKAVEPSD